MYGHNFHKSHLNENENVLQLGTDSLKALKGLSDVLPTSKSKNEAFPPHHITMSATIRASDLLEATSTPTLNGANGGWLGIVLFTHLRTVSQQFCCKFSKSQK